MGQLDNRYFPILLDVIDQSIFTIDKDGLITVFNRAAEEITGYRATDVIGKKCSDVFRTELCTSDCPLRKTMMSGRRVLDRRVRIKTKDGRFLPVAVSTAALATKEGKILGGIEVIKDLSSLEDLKRQIDGRYRFDDIISKSEKMRQIFQLLPQIAQSDSTVLICGASGTGKELLAKTIHHQSGRKDKPFVAVNCAAMPDTLIESELFGYIRGAFTDAKRDKPGRIAQADGGTLFLDEVGDLALHVQVKLLRFLQERVYEPLGATYATRADVRVISATHRSLEQMVEEGTFRQDLYYRINIMQIDLPPLSERPEDIPLLVDHFIRRFRSIKGGLIERVSEDALAYILDYAFPGNIRELENIIERAFILCRGKTIRCEHLPNSLIYSRNHRKENGAAAGSNGAMVVPLNPLSQSERSTIQEALKRNRGNRSRTADDLGIHRSTLIRKLKRYGIA
ncbi:MAG: sigma 54-interacting transcriptional regulator [Deltaproteobacteria bacterium]|nr:sigma 54-interacting transcriptional regulator [Deltaproteobacteria bacterium]